MNFQSKSMRINSAWRSAMNYLISGLSMLATVLVILPLLAILFYLLYKGASSLNLAFFTHIPSPVGEAGGGMANSIVGSGIILLLASLMGVPIGIAAGVYLAEFGRGRALATAVRFTADVLNGVPSIVMGISIYSLIVVEQKHFSALAGGVALAIMMVPTITRTTEEMLATVPHAIREAALGLGVPKWRTVISVSLRTASPGIITGCMLAFARVAEETATTLLLPPLAANRARTGRRQRRSPFVDLHRCHLPPRHRWSAASGMGRFACPDSFDHGVGHAGPHLCQPRRTQRSQLVGVGILVEDLNAWYGSNHTLQDINLHIPANHATALIGPSGCGKSTFVRCLNRMHETNPIARATGVVKMGEVDIYKDASPVEIRRRVGMVFQRPNPFPTMSIYDNVVSGLKLNGFRNRRILDETCERSLKQAALWEEVKDDLKKKSGASLSGGQQQRMCIARALAVDPEVLLMDEPASALDPVSTSKIEDLIFQLKSQYTIVIVTHNMQQAARVAENTGFFLNGKMVEFDSTHKIFTNPKDKRTEDYITGRFG